jgi:hypothetical protein
MPMPAEANRCFTRGFRVGPTVMRDPCLEQATVVNVGDNLGVVLDRVEAVKAQHHRLRFRLELPIPPQRVRIPGVMDILEAHRLRVGPGQGDLRRVPGKQRWWVDGDNVDQLRGVWHGDGRVEHQRVGGWGDAALAVDRGAGVAACTDCTKSGASWSESSSVPAG